MLCSLKKGFFVDEYLVKKVIVQNEVGIYNVIKIWLCCFMVIFDMIGYIIGVYDGCKYVLVFVIELMVGYKFGEFVLIRIFKGYVKDDKKVCRC